VSAALDALDRGVIEAGLIAAQALARAEAAEARVRDLEARMDAWREHMGRILAETGRAPRDLMATLLKPPPTRHHLSLAPIGDQS
jgi:hypothetical protein